MKTKISLILLILASSFTFWSCKEDPSDSFDSRDDLIGTWNVVEKEANNPAPINMKKMDDAYVVLISKSEIYESDVDISNFFQLGNDFVVTASIDNKDITIEKTTINDITTYGSGLISNNNKEITWSYWVDMGDGIETEYTATYTK